MNQSPQFDPRPVPQLIDIALASEDDGSWEEIAALHWRGTREVLEAAVALSVSELASHRALAAEILGQLGVPNRTFPTECFAALSSLLEDLDNRVISSAIYALGHLDAKGAAERILPFGSHADANVRLAVAFALASVDTDKAIGTLLSLMTDVDADVRDWATFAIGSQSDFDSPAIRAALSNNLRDEDADVRFEAVCGLGRRRDLRAIPYLQAFLDDDPDDVFARIAAGKLVGLPADDETTTAEMLAAMEGMGEGSL